MMDNYYISQCCEATAIYEIDEATGEGVWRCDACDEVCEVEKIQYFDRDDIAYEKARNRGWND